MNEQTAEILARRNAEAAAACEPLRAPPGAFPVVRAIVADLRAEGLEPTLTYAAEGGLEIGRRGPEGIPISLPHRKAKRPAAYR